MADGLCPLARSGDMHGEAHQELNKAVAEEDMAVRLDSLVPPFGGLLSRQRADYEHGVCILQAPYAQRDIISDISSKTRSGGMSSSMNPSAAILIQVRFLAL
mmetsp:Transcript_76572/g.237104  ORF Transcript_76572/g.237104 Transcript_76572/m.237104 type:complete len:102 (-) Transcript_76572:107-412(-)